MEAFNQRVSTFLLRILYEDMLDDTLPDEFPNSVMEKSPIGLRRIRKPLLRQ
jgi:hypothetical protein